MGSRQNNRGWAIVSAALFFTPFGCMKGAMVVDEGGPNTETCPGGECTQQQTCIPTGDESCNGFDDDCDGDTDEGVTNACGHCDDASCVTHGRGLPGFDPFDEPDPTSGLELTKDGGLTLSFRTSSMDFAWPSNDLESTVSAVDTVLDREVGRYASVLRIPGGDPEFPTSMPDVADWEATCVVNANTGARQRVNAPSRTTVDGRGNAYVANRAHRCTTARRGSVTKIGRYDPVLCQEDLSMCECVDRNGNGRIETSRDCNGYDALESGLCPEAAVTEGHGPIPDGIDINNPKEFLGYDDECLLWTKPVGPGDSNGRAMAIDPDGFIWVGDWQGMAFYKLHPDDGSFVDPDGAGPLEADTGVPVLGRPYGAIVDSKGRLWYHSGGTAQYVDTRTAEVWPSDRMTNTDAPYGYGITIDRNDRVWFASHRQRGAETNGVPGGLVVRYDPDTDSHVSFVAGLPGSPLGRGITATGAGAAMDGAGLVWAAFHDGGQSWIVGFNDVSGAVEDVVDLTASCGAATAIGMGIGTGDTVLAVARGSDNVCKYDPRTTRVSEISIGDGPYTYSDFTGNVFATFTKPEGIYRQVHSCADGLEVEWLSLEWVGETPGESTIEVQVRNGDNPTRLPNAPVSGPMITPGTTSWDLSTLGLEGHHLMLEFRLLAGEDDAVPTFRGYQLIYDCREPPA